MKFIKLLTILIILLLTFSCLSNRGSDTHLYDLKFIKEDYSREDLLRFQSIGNNEEISCYWEISEESLEKQKEYNIQELLSNICFNELIRYSDVFINEGYSGKYKSKYIFKSFEYELANKKKYGISMNIKRNDWILVFNYSTPESDYDVIWEKVFMLPDGTIIISSTNYEDIREDS